MIERCEKNNGARLLRLESPRSIAVLFGILVLGDPHQAADAPGGAHVKSADTLPAPELAFEKDLHVADERLMIAKEIGMAFQDPVRHRFLIASPRHVEPLIFGIQ